MTEFAWTGPGLPTVELFIEPSNLAFIAVAARCGCRRQELVAGHSDLGGTPAGHAALVGDPALSSANLRLTARKSPIRGAASGRFERS